jgi:hypothetical protein
MAEDASAGVAALPVRGAVPSLGDNVDLRELIPGAESVFTPVRYGDLVWDLNGYPLVNKTVDSIDFQKIPARWRTVVKDWVLLRLNPALATNGASGLRTEDVMAPAAAAARPLKFNSVVAYVRGLSVSLEIIDSNSWFRMGPDDWSSFAVQLADKNPDASSLTLAGYSRPLLSLWSYRGLLGQTDMFGTRPFNGRTVEQVFKVPARGLNIERPAPELCGPVLGLSLFILDHCAEDILTRVEVLGDVPDISDWPREAQRAAVTNRLLAWEQSGRQLPGAIHLRSGYITASWGTFVKLAGCSPRVLRSPAGESKAVFDRLRAKVGVSTLEDGFEFPIGNVKIADGTLRQWINALPPTKFNLGLYHWSATLAYCCAFIITALTTVRDRELAALPHNCLVEGTYERGDFDVPVTRMRGYLVKNRSEPLAATWVVGDDVIRAVKVIHRLKKALRLQPRFHPETGEEILLHPDLAGTYNRDERSDTLSLSETYLTWFRTSGAHLAIRGLVPHLPHLPDWLSHRTIRITGVEAYASQPWGDVLAAAQAKWSSRTVAEGYLGHLPRSVFIADPNSVEEARQRSIAQVLLDVAHDTTRDPGTIAGRGKARLDAVLEAAHAHELATGPVTGRQLLQISKKNPNVFVGELTICVHGPGGLCGNDEEADFKLCRPFVCRNSSTTPSQRARLELRRRGWESGGGVFDRARKKIEFDVPGLADEFRGVTDAALRLLILDDLPGRFQRAAEEEGVR